ncbi:serine/threonine-protein kinase [Rubricoccus marinus]|uniref:Protein kinase domain-containing protein n=1 Tax=Rubricoccus marinus TaxID=716817 RepID=A0A259TXB5_9BACT|nr:serine/threonine-protein kinase [Rubricoccus marinus]OZC02214.1 hypothetical protein BSZ36_03955 [Rubricoccus marinus]
MTPDLWSRVQDLFLAAQEQPEAQRANFVRREAAGDEPLAREVLSLLGVDASGVLEGSAVEALGDEGLREITSGLAVGERLGPYRIGEEIGRGGMGTVYRAERADGAFEQTVALKLVKRGMDTDAVLRRFEAERRILARLEHPGIARLLDGGQTRDGRPYLVMEYVEGEPITDYCDRQRLGVDARLALFRQVCEAVQYAHHRLVVHRDLKPGNVLVASGDAGPRVKLLDFGIARLLTDDAEEPLTVLTAPGQLLLTPEYAAPEQVLGGTISTATDVYALGVLLYELLTGRRPYTFDARTPGVIEHVVATVQPPRPSTVVGTPPDAPTPPEASGEADSARGARPSGTQSLRGDTMDTHGSTVDRLRRRIAGDLDVICLMALRKEPERRYASVEALVGDLKRHEESLPVLARPDTVGYRARSFARRHRVGLLAAATSGAVIALVTAAAFVRVGAERDRAETEAQTSSEVSALLAGIFTGADPTQTRGADVTARELLAAGIDRVRADLADEPEVQAHMLHSIGDVYSRLDEFEAAESALDEALALRRRVHGTNHPNVGVTLGALGHLYERQGRYADARGVNQQASDILHEHAGTHKAELADVLHNLAHSEMRLVEVESALAHIEEAIALKREVFGPRSAEVAYSMNVLGDVLNFADRLDESEAVHLETLAIREETIGTEHMHTSHTYHNLAATYREMERWPEAERFYREALRVKRIHYGEGGLETAQTVSQLGYSVAMQGRFDEAERLHSQAIATVGRVGNANGSIVAPMLARRREVLMEEGRYAEAEAAGRQGLRLWRESIAEPTPWVPRWVLGIGAAVAAQGRNAEAARLIEQSRGLCSSLAHERQRLTCVADADAAAADLGA